MGPYRRWAWRFCATCAPVNLALILYLANHALNRQKVITHKAEHWGVNAVNQCCDNTPLKSFMLLTPQHSLLTPIDVS